MSRGIQFDEGTFHPRRVMLVRHGLPEAPDSAVIGELLTDLAPVIEKRDPGIDDGGGRFVTSSPFNMVAENMFLLQCSGTRQVTVWDPLDREVVSERCLELFHTRGSRELLVFHRDFLTRATTVDLEPGMGVYIPATAPFQVNDGAGSLLAVAYSTRAIREAQVLYKSNDALRELGLSPHAVGESSMRGRLRDKVKLAAAKLLGR